jgi:NAD(P)-dependent dehydrogenase (short-subunit alcohol dehydrogenase family)
MQNFEDRVVVVTGGASGIGLALGRRFGRSGMKVVLGDVEAPALERAVGELRDSGVDASGVRCDVTDPAQMDALAQAALDAHGAVHVFCNNAGVGGGGLSWETPLSTWEWVLGVNLWGVVHGVRTFMPILLEQDEAHIVNTASVAGLVAAPFMGPYNASKHAVVAISETLHHELTITGARARVSVLCPGWVNTAIGTSERNRPERLAMPEPSVEQAAQGETMRAMLQSMLDSGMSTDRVADQVFDAIHDERFWVLTHSGEGDDSWTTAVHQRLDSVRDETNPVLNLMA